MLENSETIVPFLVARRTILEILLEDELVVALAACAVLHAH
jgi:hypothetical protein